MAPQLSSARQKETVSAQILRRISWSADIELVGISASTTRGICFGAQKLLNRVRIDPGDPAALVRKLSTRDSYNTLRGLFSGDFQRRSGDFSKRGD